jgi:hypothetical protein
MQISRQQSWGEDLKKCMDNAAYSYTRDGFDATMEEMKK